MINASLKLLEQGPAHAFHDWPTQSVPKVAMGIYTVWEGERLLYARRAGDTLTKSKVVQLRKHGNQRRGLYERLTSHAFGRRTADQFCLSICDRLVLPSLTVVEIAQIARGDLSLNDLTRHYIRERLIFRFIEVDDPRAARSIEKAIRRGALTAGKPLLNPA